MHEQHTLTYDNWFDQFAPIANPNGDSGFCVGDECYLFEPSRPEDAKALKNAAPTNIWTYIDGDEGEPVIVAGICRVNSLGYFITKKSHDDKPFEVLLD